MGRVYAVVSFLMLFLAEPYTINGQPNFLKIYNFVGAQQINNVIQTSNNDFLLVGSTQSFVYVVRTDSLGNILWTKTFGSDQGEGNGIKLLKTSAGFIILGLDTFQGTTIRTINDNGDLLSEIAETDSVWYGYDILPNTNSGLTILAVRYQQNTLLGDILIVKTDLSGVTLSGQSYGEPGENESPVKFFQLGDGGLIVLGNTTELTETPYYRQFMIFRTDYQGKILWKKIVAGNAENIGKDFIATSDGNYVIASAFDNSPGLLSLTKIDINGDVLWTQNISGQYEGEPNRLVETSHGNLIIVGQLLKPYIPGGQTLVWGTTSTGNLIWQKVYAIRPESDSFGFTIDKTNDNQFLVSGIVGQNLVASNTDFFLLKIDSTGCAINPPNLGSDLETCDSNLLLNAGSGYSSYRWNTDSTRQSMEVTSSGSYSVIVKDDQECTRTDTINVEIKKCVVYDRCKNEGYDAKQLEIPNVITPNNDSWNEFFVLPETLAGSKLLVCNRWGAQVYLSESYYNRWDGGELASGIYFYSVSNKCFDRTIKGVISIVK